MLCIHGIKAGLRSGSVQLIQRYSKRHAIHILQWVFHEKTAITSAKVIAKLQPERPQLLTKYDILNGFLLFEYTHRAEAGNRGRGGGMRYGFCWSCSFVVP